MLTTADRSTRGTALLWVERLSWIVGLGAIAFWSVAGLSGLAGACRSLDQFAAAQAARSTPSVPDQRLWSPERIRAWHDALTRDAPPPLAVLRIPRLNLEVPILEGTDEWTLNRAVGHIEDTAKPGEGNAGIAGHRDGFFRGLKDIHTDDVLEIETTGSIDRYRVERTWIVEPEDVSVLDPTDSPSVTLVTCYPFYYVGSAPQRFIVRAVRTETTAKRKMSV